jgi:cytochrome c
MNLEINKIAGGVLGACLFVMVLGVVSNAIYAPAPMKTPGYALPGAVAEHEAAPAAAAAPSEPLPVLLAKADAQRGQAAAKPCATCHSFDKGGPAKIGPPLYGVVGRPKGAVAGYAYSDGLKAKGGDWSFADIDHLITNPKAFIPNTKMAFPGEKDDAKRADILLYLRSLADTPTPLPTK